MKFGPRPAKSSPLGEALGTDHEMVAKLVEMSQDGTGAITPRPVGLNELAWARGCTEGKVAMAMKYAVKHGYVARSHDARGQAQWTPTRLGLETFAGDSVVMPEQPTGELRVGGKKVAIQGVPQSEVKQWEDDKPELPPSSDRQLP